MKTNCCKDKVHTFKTALAKAQHVRYDGRDYIVAPVILAKSDVVMNGGVLPVDEMNVIAWDGVPVTVGHPVGARNANVSANSPEILEKWCVGRIFHCEVKNGNLIGEAWIDVLRAQAISPGMVEIIEAGEPLDVSTGYFCTPETAKGALNGEAFAEVHRAVIPDHLALLPNETGACNWEDGCGVRSNKDTTMAKLTKLLKKLNTKKTNAQDPAAMVASLIASENSPFSASDAEALGAMSAETLAVLVEEYAGPAEEPVTEEAEVVPPKKEEEPVKKEPAANAALSDEDKAAIDYARRIHKEHKDKLVAKVVANSAITKEQAEAMPVATLEVVANGIKAPAAAVDFSGRAVPNANTDEDLVKTMVSSGTLAVFASKKGK